LTDDKDKLKQLYTDLQREYDLTLDRRKTLNGQAANLMSFAGIIETVLVGLILTLATNKDARSLLAGSTDYHVLLILAGAGFVSYILTAAFAIVAFHESKWTRVPQMPDSDPLKSIDDFYSKPQAYNLAMFAKQISYATGELQKTNDLKFLRLRLALIFLLLGIVVTAIAGLMLIVIVG